MKKKYSFDIVLLIMALFLYACTLCFNTALVSGTSMEPNLKDGNRYIFRTRFFQVSRGDIVVIETDSKTIVKRIIGLPGEVISVHSGYILINDRELLECAYLEKRPSNGHKNLEIIIPENNYFVLGDNRENSLDSRSIGTIHKKNIKGIIVKSSLLGDFLIRK